MIDSYKYNIGGIIKGVISLFIIMFLLTGCGSGEDTEVKPTGISFSKKYVVGEDIQNGDITDFYYTVENINYDAFYQRYRIYVEDGKHMFFHEKRERKNDYGPATEEDTTRTGTMELSEEQWSKLYDFLDGGVVKAREESSESGGSGPWLYLYWTNDKSKYQQFTFDSYDTETAFEDYCDSLASDSEGGIMYKLEFDGYGFKSDKTRYSEGEEVTAYYDIFATDTDYSFYTDSEDVDLKQAFDSSKGYVFTFTMPAHDVTLSVKSRNSMEYDPDANNSYDPDDPSNIGDTGNTGDTDNSENDLSKDNTVTETWFCPECGCKNDRKYCSDCGFKKPE